MTVADNAIVARAFYAIIKSNLCYVIQIKKAAPLFEGVVFRASICASKNEIVVKFNHI